MWIAIVGGVALLIALLVVGMVWAWDRFTPLARHPLYESVFDQVQELEARRGINERRK